RDSDRTQMTRTLQHLILLAICLALVVDQFFFAKEETTTYAGQHALREERPKGRGLYRWRRWNEKPGPRLGAQVHAELWHVAVLDNDRWFQYHQRDNGLLSDGDTVRIEVSPLTGRVLRFQPMGRSAARMRETVDAYTEIAPIPALMAVLLLWSLLLRPGPNARTYLHWTVLLLAIIFLLGVFAMSWPTLKLLGWA
ncbi:MAG: hypothetical protein ACK6A5_03765, partial [Flavobacteriales bacterium]